MSNIQSKYCTKCKKRHIVELFFKDKSQKDGYQLWCKKEDMKITLADGIMNASIIERKVSARTRLPIRYTMAVIKAFREVALEQVEKKGEFHLFQIGTIKGVMRKGKRCYDINTKTVVEIPEDVAVRFFPAIKLKQAVRKEKKD